MLFFLASQPPLSHTSSEASASFDAWTSGRPSCQKHLPKFSAIVSIARPYRFFPFYLPDPRRLPRNADMFGAVLHLPSFLPPPFLYIPASGGSQHLFSPLSSGVSSSLTGGYTGRRGGWEKNNRYPQIRSDRGRMPYSLLHTSDNSSRSVKPPLLCFILPSVFLAVNRYFLSLLFLPSSQLASASGSHSPPHPSVSSPALPPFFFCLSPPCRLPQNTLIFAFTSAPGTPWGPGAACGHLPHRRCGGTGTEKHCPGEADGRLLMMGNAGGGFVPVLAL